LYGKTLYLVAGLALAVWLAWSLPLALGERTLFLRDVFSFHLPLKAFGAAELRAGSVPALNPTWGLGQPFRGNPNAVAFYPGNVLYLLFPFWSAFNLHFVLHWLLAALTMIALARELGQGRMAALLAGITWAGSGWVMTAMSFYTTLAVTAWWPLVVWGAVRGGRRGLALGGAACGLALLGGEPVMAAVGLIPLLAAAAARHGLRRGLLHALAVGSVGLLVALPQAVASLRVIGFSYRGALGTQGGRYSLDAWRLLELLVPYPAGLPWDFGTVGLYPLDGRPGLPYILTLHFGVVGLWLALLGARRARVWSGLALSGLVLAWAGGGAGDVLAHLTGGLLRYPEKFLFWFALAVPLLAGFGLDRMFERAALARILALGGAALAGLLALGVWAERERLAAWVADGLPEGALSEPAAAATAAARLGLWLLSLAGAALLLALAAGAARLRKEGARGAALAVLQIVGLSALLPMAARAPVALFEEAPWARRLPAGAAVLPGEPAPPPERLGHAAELSRLLALELAPAPGVLHGLTYPLAENVDGMSTSLQSLVEVNAKRLSGRERAGWLRVLGVDAAVLDTPPDAPALRLLDVAERAGSPSYLAAVADPAPLAWWPREVATAAGPAQAFFAVARGGDRDDPLARVVAAAPVEHRPGAGCGSSASVPTSWKSRSPGGAGCSPSAAPSIR
jgi:hypothetical protein